ncbi:Allophanate hydrolase subunit 1 [Thermosinus carboxydivorans Nor1]|uniref:Allophanate hydrolase subunit 1 n=1 Tax=Thermosinus carboxydivorans Nor1 TaxID=401526 RepID=A1HPE2_9FIRM|nr:5-oxoprolinase subunit PxpB [Thermosinus carboxydivorans]EAX48248.1 Allophanate hydrolase subunit 1 [Thermosinus carboxydivorans Nor1]
MDGVRILPAGEQAIVVEFGQAIDPDINRRVHQLGRQLAGQKLPGIIEVVPTYRSLLIYFDPLIITRQTVAEQAMALLASGNTAETGDSKARIIHIPVCYGGEFGPDIGFVANHNGLTEAEVIEIHTSVPYLIYMLGFTPGFPYLGGMSPRIATPRLEKPRTRIPAGSVGIAGTQTGFYPIESPGGWQLIGRTPVKAFDPQAATPFLFAAGDYLKFYAVSAEEYETIAKDVAAGRYAPTITEMAVEGGIKS